MVFGLLGARLYDFAFFDPQIFFKQPWEILAVWKGGLALHGGLLAGLLVVIWFCRTRKIPFWKLADALPTPMGALLSGFFPDHVFQRIVAFAAGTFLYIGAGDLLPEAHRRFNMRVVLSLLLGAALVPLLSSLARL